MTGERRHIGSGSVWEERVCYSRAVRVGHFVFVSGTTCDGPDAYTQAKGALAKIERALEEAGAVMEDVVRTRMFVKNIDDWADVGRAHADVFRDIMPASTMLEVSKLISPDLLVEIEADAFIE